MQLVLKYFFCIICLIFNQYGISQIFTVDSLAIDTIKQIKEVKPIEANFLFSYYEQDGTKSPVTGGIGDEALTDMVGNISLNIPVNNKLAISFSAGIDVYTSASTDNINNEHGLYTETSASRRDSRVSGDLGVLLNNDKRRITYGVGIGISKEYDVESYSVNASFSKISKNRNTLFYFKGSAYNDKWSLIYPSELRWRYQDGNQLGYNSSNVNEEVGVESTIRNTYNGSIAIEQDLSPRLKGALTIESTYQTGLLSTPFHRIYFIDFPHHDIERLPDNRLKIPIGTHLNYYVNKIMVVRLFYRYYFDDFGIKAHTSSIEIPLKPIKTITVAPFYRYHTQTASKYFKPYGFHSENDDFYTSDYDLADIQSNRVGLELRFSPQIKSNNEKKKIVFKKIIVRASKYYRLRQDELILKSFIVALGVNFRIE